MIKLKSLFELNTGSYRWRWVIGASMLLMLLSLTSITAQTTAEEISGTETWSGTVHVTGDVTVVESGLLTIQPGTRVLFDGKFLLNIDKGQLVIQGTAGQPVIFTSGREEPQTDDWGGIQIISGTATLQHVTVEYAGTGIVIRIAGAHTFNNCTFRNNQRDGVRIEGGGFFSMSDLVLNENKRHGLSIRSNDANVNIRNMECIGNKEHGVTSGNLNLNLNIDGGLIQGNQKTGIAVGEGVNGEDTNSSLVLKNLVITENGDWGIWTDRRRNEFIQCELTKNGRAGIKLERAAKNAIFGDCLIAENSGKGIEGLVGWLGDADRLEIRNSRIFENGSHGIDLDIWRASGVSNNKPRLIVSNSRIEDNGGIGIIADEWTLIENSQILRNESGIGSRNFYQMELIGNTISQNTSWGIYFADQDPIPLVGEGITGNEISFNGKGIISLWRGEPITSIIGNDFKGNGFQVEVLGTGNLDLSGNFWGDFMTPMLESQADNITFIADQKDNPKVGLAIIDEWSPVSVLAPEPAPLVLHPGDNNPADSRIGIGEVTAYGAAWKSGSDWVVGPNPIPIGYLTRAGALWKGGETYIQDPNVSEAPLWWVNGMAENIDGATNRPRAAKAGLSGEVTAVRTSILEVDVGGRAVVQVTVAVSPSGRGAAWAVEEFVGMGQIVSDINENGYYDTQHGFVRWGPYFDQTPRRLQYKTVHAETSLLLPGLGGVVSVDGRNSAIAADSDSEFGKALSIQRDKDGRLSILLNNGFSEDNRIETSDDLKKWSPLQTPTSSVDRMRISLPNDTGGQRYYRVVPAR